MWYKVFIAFGVIFWAPPVLADDLASMVSLEKKHLEKSKEERLERCKSKGGSNKEWMHCTSKVKEDTEEKFAQLKKDPELYFYDKGITDQKKAIRREVRKELNARGY